MPAPASIDIFCRVVDNYGDIGVCWRLARQLAARLATSTIRLWVDDLASFARIARGISTDAPLQTVGRIRVVKWDDVTSRDPGLLQPAAMVIEAFACSPPEAYVARMSDRQLWLNLEYLSAEDWVESCHGLPSIQPNGLRKFFFFPGFTPRTGGLLREGDLLARRDRWQADPHARPDLLSRLGVEAAWLDRLQAGARLVYVFCYPQAPLEALLRTLASTRQETLVLMAQGVGPNTPPLPAGGRLALRRHEFVDQDTFDQLLWSADLNLVRGEDSLLRAIWAARPMIWQPYRQEDALHLQKLDAWLARSPYSPEIRRVMQAWNGGSVAEFESALAPLLAPAAFAQWQHSARAGCDTLAREDDLVTRLLAFHAKQHQTR